MKKINILFFTILANLVVFLKLPHLVWIPSFIGTWFTSKGLVYYKDFIQAHIVFSHAIIYPFYKMFRWNFEVGPVFALVVTLLSTISIYKVLEKRSKFTIAISLIHFTLFSWFYSTWVQYSQELLAGLFILPLVNIILTNSYTKSKKILILQGTIISIVLMTAQILAPFIFIYTIILLFKVLRNKPKISSLFILFGSFSLPFFFFSLYFYSKGALYDMYYWNFPYYFIYSRLQPSTANGLPWLDIIIYFLPLLVIVPSKEKNKLIFIFLYLSLIPSILFSVFHPHHFLIALTFVSVTLGVFMKKNLVSYIVLLSFLVYTIFNLYPWYSSKLRSGFVPTNLSADYETYYDQTSDWIKKETSPTSRIIVAADPIFYFKSDRLPANRYFSVLPWHYLPIEETEKVFVTQKPDYWVVESDYMERIINGWKRPEINEFIQGQISECYEKVYENVKWSVYKKQCV